jgi:uncharacterized protein (TIGR01777 family)
MDYLLTGATGFIGQKLVKRLLNSNNGVNYLGRRRSTTLDSRAAFHRWDVGQLPPLDSVPTVDAVINLAGEPIAQRWNAEVKRRIRDSRVEGTRQLVTAISKLRHKPSVLVSASAVGYYGDRGDEILTESSPPANDFLAQICIDWEREALRAREFGLRVVLVRISTVLGRDGGALPKMLTPFKLGIGGKFGTGRQWMPWIHVDDLVELIVFAAGSSPIEGPVNASSPKPVTNNEFTKALAVALHRPALFPVPQFALRLALGEMADFAFKSERVVPAAAERASFPFQYPSLASALQSLL